MLLELIPISTLLTLLTTQILETAVAAQDVLVEKETFRLLSSFLMGIQPVLSELMKRNVSDSAATRQALISLRDDVQKARVLIDTCKTKSKIYMLLHCRSIVRQAEQISRDVAKSLALLSLASTEVAVDISDNVDKLRQQMLEVEFQASEQKLRIVEKIETGLQQQQNDQNIMTDLIREIARAVGLPNEEAESKKVLESLQREIEEASLNKKREEVFYMEQILALLSNADKPAPTPEPIGIHYRKMNFLTDVEEELPPLPSFICPLSKDVMKDPVSIATGSTFERSWIQGWFEQGNRTDPITKSILTDLTLRRNIQVRNTIEEWSDRNMLIRVRKAGNNLMSSDVLILTKALEDLSLFSCSIPKAMQWIEAEQLTGKVVELIKHQDRDVKKKSFLALQTLVVGNDIIKKQLVDANGVEQIVRCLGRGSLSKLAMTLLIDLLQAGTADEPHKNYQVQNKLTKVKGSIFLLVTALLGEDAEAAQLAKVILEQLGHKDQNIIEMAKSNYFTPLIQRLSHGSDESKVVMAHALANMELTELNKGSLGEGGAVVPLVTMLSTNLEAKAAALKALESLSDLENNKKYIAKAGAVPIMFQIIFSSKNPATVRLSAVVILERLVMVDGQKYLVDADGAMLDLAKTVQSLLVLQMNSSNVVPVQKHVLLLLLRLAVFADTKEMMQNAGGVSTLLPLLECPEREIRDIVLQLLSCLSEGRAQEVAHFIVNRRLGGHFASWLQGGWGRADVQVAAAGILASLPPEDNALTAYLTQEGVLEALVGVLREGTATAKEKAASSILRFTSPTSVSLQQRVVEMGVFHLVRSLISSGTPRSKERAAIILGNLSRSTLYLSQPPARNGCFFMLKKGPSVCKVHLGPCTEMTTFCLVESKLTPDIISLLNEQQSDAAAAGVDALLTLILEEDILERGAHHLHEERAIIPIIKLLSHSTDSTKEKAVLILERLFRVKKIRDLYGQPAKTAFLELAVNGNKALRKQASNMLVQLEAFPCQRCQ